MQDAHLLPRQREAAVVGDVQDLGEAGILVAAQRRVDHMVGDDARILGVVADAAQRALAERARFVDVRGECDPQACYPFASSNQGFGLAA